VLVCLISFFINLTVPKNRSAKFFLTIPDGSACIVQKNGVDLGEWEPGRRVANFEHRIMYVVTKQACAYEYDVVQCPTKDNVMVEVNMTFVFNINHPAQFCYRLGAYNFDDLLQSVAEEAIRNLVRSTKFSRVFELRSSAAEQLQQLLNISFKNFGVVFSSVTVTHVSLPPELSQELEEASKIDAQLKEHQEMVENKERTITDKADRRFIQYQEKQQRILANCSAKKERMMVTAQTEIEKQRRYNENELLRVQEQVAANLTRAKASLRDDAIIAQAEAEKVLQDAKNNVKNRKAEADQFAVEELMKSELELLAAETDLNVQKKLAKAKEAEALAKDREQRVKLAKINALSLLAERGHIVLSGESGQSVIDMFSF
jgi:regulator of protease activity HflC (stomatin/prohibitin superfamily)